MTEAPTAAQIAGKLTKAQREVVRQWPDAWMAASEVMHVRVVGNVVSVLADKGLFERRSDPNVWGRSQYRLNELGTAVRAILMEQDRDDR